MGSDAAGACMGSLHAAGGGSAHVTVKSAPGVINGEDMDARARGRGLARQGRTAAAELGGKNQSGRVDRQGARSGAIEVRAPRPPRDKEGRRRRGLPRVEQFCIRRA